MTLAHMDVMVAHMDFRVAHVDYVLVHNDFYPPFVARGICPGGF